MFFSQKTSPLPGNNHRLTIDYRGQIADAARLPTVLGPHAPLAVPNQQPNWPRRCETGHHPCDISLHLGVKTQKDALLYGMDPQVCAIQ